MIQEYFQKQGWALPQYNVTDIQGEAHNQTFYVTLCYDDKEITGVGKSRKLAEQAAAAEMIYKLGIKHD